MAVMLVRALDYDQLALSMADATLPFSDVTTHRGYIALVTSLWHYHRGTAGRRELPFPHASANREIAAAMLVRAYERYTAKPTGCMVFTLCSYSQIGMTAQMDAVSLGWARMDVDSATALSSTRARPGRTSGSSPVRPQPGHRCL